MICRYYTKCPGCDSIILLRLSVGKDKEQPFFYLCKNCNSATRGKLFARIEPEPTIEVELEQGDLFPMFTNYDQAVNIHPDLPAIPNAGDMSEKGGSPFITLMQLLGDEKREFYGRLDSFRENAENYWLSFKRIVNYYLDSNWTQFDKQIESLNLNNWPENPSELQRHDILHKLIDILTYPLWIYNDYPDMKIEWNHIYKRTIEINPNSLNKYLMTKGLDFELINLQRDLFHCLELFIETRSSYLPSLAIVMLSRRGHSTREFRLFRDEFPVLRDMYISIFEACHKTLKHIVAFLNILNRGDHNCFPNGYPKNLNKFMKLSNAKKYEYIEECGVWYQKWSLLLNRNLRNSIGHLSVRHDLASGNLILKSSNELPYLDFVVLCLNLIHPLLACSNAIKIIRIALFLNK